MAKSKSSSGQRELAPPPKAATKPTNLVEATFAPPEDPIEADALAALETVKSFEIATTEDYEQAASARKNLRERLESVEKRHRSLKKPFLEGGRQVDAWFSKALKAYEQAGELITDKMKKYEDEQRRLAEEKARKEREEAARKALEQRQRMEMAMTAIEGINYQVTIAVAGRLGVRKGGTLECIDETLAETEAWQITEDTFGEWIEAARKAKEAAITQIKQIRQRFLEAEEEKRRVAQALAEKTNAEEDKKAAEAEAAEQRKKAVQARKDQIKAELAAKHAKEEADRLRREAEENAAKLEQQAANVKVEDTTVEVAGLSRAKVMRWRILDKRKLKDDFLLVDEKTINKLVISMRERVHSVVGEGAIEIYEDTQLRQQR